MNSNDIRASKANRITWIGLLTNVVLTGLKLTAGIIGRSGAMIADAIHSLSDFITDAIVLLSFKMIRRPIDHEHDYGHGKFETIATAFIGIALFILGFRILWTGGKNIYASFNDAILKRPGYIALIAAFISIITKEWLYRITVKVGNKINSQAVIANAWHHRSDAFSSIGVTIGIGGAILLGERWRILDPIAAVIVSFFIIRIAIPITIGSVRELLEESLNEDIEDDIIQLTKSIEGVIDPHDLRTRKIGNNIAVDLHIYVKKDLSICVAHDISIQIEKKIKDKFGEDTFISVHIEPNILEE